MQKQVPDNSSVASYLDDKSKNIDRVLDSYSIQLIEERRRKDSKDTLKLQYYFDSFDIESILHGALEYVSSHGFNSTKYKTKLERELTLVYAFVFQGIYKPTKIRMLEPHKIEFLNRVYPHSNSMKTIKNPKEVEGIVLDILHLLYDHSDKKTNLSDFLNQEDFEKIIDKSPEIFRVNYFLKEFPFWKRRLKYLTLNKILALDSIGDELLEIQKEDIELFKLISSGFEQARSYGGDNNFYDSLAFFHLQKLLDDHIADNTKPLPIFFASTLNVKKAIRIIREHSPELFSYDSGVEGLGRIPIVRDALFFTLEPIFSIGDNTESFFKNFKKTQSYIRDILDIKYQNTISKSKELEDNFLNTKRKFEKGVWEIVEVKLAKQMAVSYDTFNKSVQDTLKWDSSKIEEKIEEQLFEILRETEENLNRTKQLSAIVRTFRSINSDVNIVLRETALDGELDIFRDFALIKFGIDSRKFPSLQDLIESFISHEGRMSEASPILYQVLSSLSGRITSEVKADRFLQGIVVAWLLQKYRLIVELCSTIDHKDQANRYETALIYAASLLLVKPSKKNSKKVLDIIQCILSKKENYKVWLGVSYLFYRMWEIENTIQREIPEMQPKQWKIISSLPSYNDFFNNGTIKYLDKSYNELKKNVIEEELVPEEQIDIYLTYFLYALNNLIYYTTKSGSKAQFNNLQNHVGDLKKYEKHKGGIWQGRFYDTLGWYSLRSAFNVEPQFKNRYINQAKKYLAKAQQHIASPRDKILFEELEEAIFKVEMG